MITGINHVAVSVPDIKKAIDFYREVLGLEAWHSPTARLTPEAYIEEVTQLKGCTADCGSANTGYGVLEVWEFTEPRGEEKEFWRPINEQGIAYICLAVDDIWAEYERLKEQMEFQSPPVKYSYEGPENNSWMAFARDPFGNVIKFWQPGHEDPLLFAPEVEWTPGPGMEALDQLK